jgi:hypothetical protein
MSPRSCKFFLALSFSGAGTLLSSSFLLVFRLLRVKKWSVAGAEEERCRVLAVDFVLVCAFVIFSARQGGGFLLRRYGCCNDFQVPSPWLHWWVT